ncbi:hypothetical protein RRG08_016316 [Elysia crispata]|uniref:Uncharacterized protein n=1 Tax=Elysia crispata TaxID=231223 RepID=A0AAE1E605_9GAST|nr:hypothetical protein RRG08_016316 [Elysia crispata]
MIANDKEGLEKDEGEKHRTGQGRDFEELTEQPQQAYDNHKAEPAYILLSALESKRSVGSRATHRYQRPDGHSLTDYK